MLNVISISCALILVGCQLNGTGDQVGTEAQEVLTANRLTANRLTANRLTANRLTANRLTANAMTDEVLGSSPLISTEDGRELLDYIVLCALPEGTSLSAEHDGQTYQFDGYLGLAAEWNQRPLNATEKDWVSACLIAHVNAAGLSVQISVRADGQIGVTEQELRDYKVYEGTFFGNTFDEDAVYYSCLGDDADVALANSPDRALRICADDTEDCVIQSLGRCRDVCDTRTADRGWSDCWANGEMYSETVSVYLYSPDDDGNNRTCAAGGHCNFTVEHAEDGIMDCSEADNCKATCKDDSICAIDGTAAITLRANVRDEAIADVNCHEANDCRVEVQDESRVEIDCKDANDCTSITCTGGSDCLLDCTGAADCGFDVCEGELNYCEGGIVVCNRECP